MILCRRPRLATALVCLCLFIPIAAVAQPPAPPAQQPAPPAKPPEAAKPPESPQPKESPQQPNKQNPFEAVPLSAEPAKPQAPQAPKPGQPTLEAPKPAAEPKADDLTNTVEAIEFR